MITKRKTKTGKPHYCVVIRTAPQPGKHLANPRRCVGTFRTLAEAQKAERQALEKRDSGADAPVQKNTVRQLIEKYLERCRAVKELAPTTIIRYEGLAERV